MQIIFLISLKLWRYQTHTRTIVKIFGICTYTYVVYIIRRRNIEGLACLVTRAAKVLLIHFKEKYFSIWWLKNKIMYIQYLRKHVFKWMIRKKLEHYLNWVCRNKSNTIQDNLIRDSQLTLRKFELLERDFTKLTILTMRGLPVNVELTWIHGTIRNNTLG